MNTNLSRLEQCIRTAINLRLKYIGVLVSVNGNEELIINKAKNFESKLDYYRNSYNEDLTLKANKSIKIVDFKYHDSLNIIAHMMEHR